MDSIMYQSKQLPLHRIRSDTIRYAYGALEGDPDHALEAVSGITGRFAIVDVSTDDPDGYRFLHFGRDMHRKSELSLWMGKRFSEIHDDREYIENMTRDWQVSIRDGNPVYFNVETTIWDHFYLYERLCFPLPFKRNERATTLIILSQLRLFGSFHHA